MKNHKFLSGLLMLLLGGVFFMTSCGDDEDELGLIGSWKVTGAIFNPAIDTNGTTSGGLVTDAYGMLFSQPCDQDDLFIFQDGGVSINDEGATKCDPLSPQQTTGTYTQSGSVITIIEGGDTTVFNNANVSNTTLTGTVTFDFGAGEANVDFTMTRQ